MAEHRRRTHQSQTHNRRRSTQSVDRDQKFFRKTLMQAAVCLIIFVALFSMQYLPFASASAFSENVKFYLKENADFASAYRNVTAYAMENFTWENVEACRAGIVAFFTRGEMLQERDELLAGLALKRPMSGEIAGEYRPEEGRMQFVVSPNEGIVAAMDGTVKETGNNEVDGPYVILTHEKGLESYYANLSEVLVYAGDAVTAGMILGNCACGEETQFIFQLKKDGTPLDPTPYLQSLTSDAVVTENEAE